MKLETDLWRRLPAAGAVLASQTENIIATRARIVGHYDELPIVTQADSGCEPPWATM
jgi:hypothetical protein